MSRSERDGDLCRRATTLGELLGCPKNNHHPSTSQQQQPPLVSDARTIETCHRHTGRHRVLQTLVVLSMVLLQQKVASAISSNTPAATKTTTTSSSESPLIETKTAMQRDYEEEEEELLVTTHEEECNDFRHQGGEEGSHDDCDSSEQEEDILIVSTADGSLVGLSKNTGDLVWKQTGRQLVDHEDEENSFHGRDGSNRQKKHTVSEAPALSILNPLVTTTTTSQSFASRDWRTAAVPSLDGKTVYLTAHVAGNGGGGHGTTTTSNGADDSAPEITVTTSIPDLVHRAPFVDNRGRIYNGSRSSIAIAVDGNTGEILKVISADGEMSSPSLFQADIDEEDSDEEDVVDLDDPDRTWKGDRKKTQQRKKRRRKVVWMGRIDHSVSVHEPRSGNLDVQFSAAEIKSVRDMILGQNVPEDQPPWEASGPPEQLFLTTGPGDSDDATSIASTSATTATESTSLWKAVTTTPPSNGEMETCLVATPNGNLAYRDPTTGSIEWVSPVQFDSPVAFALDANSGASLPIDIVPDTPMQPSGDDYSNEYLTREIHRQYTNLLADSAFSSNSLPPGTAPQPPDPLVGTLPGKGELFAIPLGSSLRLRQRRHALLSAASSGSTTVSSLHSKPNRKPSLHSLVLSVTGLGATSNHHETDPTSTTTTTDKPKKQACFPGADNFPSCLVSPSKSSRVGAAETFIDPVGRKNGGQVVENPDAHAVVPFQEQGEQHEDHENNAPPHPLPPPSPHRKYQKILRILGSWLPPTLAMIFVVSFELGRRKRQKDQGEDAMSLGGGEHGGVIQINQNVILGYGGHGTVVYEGMLEGRKVAVKRMLQAYHASADREISLLIESDGHPNVVRYFLKEVRGDFVYLALELCDLSLHDLIGHMGAAAELMCGADENDTGGNLMERDRLAVPNAVRTILSQIANGVKHLHGKFVVHRDLKPANILLADSRKSKRSDDVDGEIQESVFEIFVRGDYVAKISDMGLGKQLVGQSSFGVGESSLQLQPKDGEAGESSIVGAGPGSVGWQAPEVMAMRMPASDTSMRSDDSGRGACASDPLPETASPSLDNTSRTSRSVDIFSLGCIFHSTLVPGSHPFGEWFEREANIMHNKPDLEELKKLSFEAFDLVSSMVKRNPSSRPTAAQVCEHPYFWSAERRLLFLCDFSDRLETEGLGNNEDATARVSHSKVIAVERNAAAVVGSAWDTILENDLVSNVQRFRTYDPSSVRDLLRVIRNKYHHFEDLPDHIKRSMGSKTDGLSVYFETRFPALLIHCFNICREILPGDDQLCKKYSIPSNLPKVKLSELVGASSSIPEATEDLPPPPQPSSQESVETSDGESQDGCEGIQEHVPPVEPAASLETDQPDAKIPAKSTPDNGCSSPMDEEHVSAADAGDVVVWECSTAAKTFNNRGWHRSDDDWVRRTDASLRKPSANLVRCMDDPKFRTRLCNHWDASQGTQCPMRKKGKCVFAHGPVELRVKESKRNRWGRLVDADGNNKNVGHSGGEDTYGAAKSIETERKQEGKWSSDKGPVKGEKGRGKKGSNAKKNPNSQRKDQPAQKPSKQ